MKILYYSGEEITKDDACMALRELGHEVTLLCHTLKDYNLDAEFSRIFLQKLDEQNYDLVFSFYFIPLISKLTLKREIRYAVWVFDSMPLTFYSIMAFSPYNYIFTFDKEDCEALKKRGIQNVFHLPLACNPSRIRRLQQQKIADEGMQNEIAFIGNLYNDDANLFDQIAHLPKEIKRRVDDLILEQLKSQGNDLLKSGVDDALVEELSRYASIERSDEYMWTMKDIFLSMVERKAAAVERQRILQFLSERFAVTLYSGSDSRALPNVVNRGYISYSEQMPLVIANSKINLHITPRAIASGMSLRILDVFAAGGFLLSNTQPELLEYFEEGSDFAAYENEDDLAKKAAYYLSHEKERQEIAENGRRKAEAQFTYQIQFGKMFEIL